MGVVIEVPEGNGEKTQCKVVYAVKQPRYLALTPCVREGGGLAWGRRRRTAASLVLQLCSA